MKQSSPVQDVLQRLVEDVLQRLVETVAEYEGVDAPGVFSIGGGTTDTDEWDGVNWKYLDSAATLSDALAKYFMWAIDYPESELAYVAPSGIKVLLTPRIDEGSLAQFQASKARWNPSNESNPLDAFTLLKDQTTN